MASQTLYLLDSDAAKKLCQYQLLYELTVALGCSLGDFAVLPQLRFQLKLDKDDKALAKLGTQAAVDLARDLVASASSVEIEADAANPLLQLNRPDIDSGEATLLLHCTATTTHISAVATSERSLPSPRLMTCQWSMPCGRDSSA